MKQHGGKRPGGGALRVRGTRRKEKERRASAQAIALAHDGLSPRQQLLNEMRQTDDDLIEMEQGSHRR